ncbi:Phage minor capsid protein 2 [Clostridium cavendishii DSM 21758]|uniref:Phage minor capsid protein 2 n=1 Tax=Clostridium cavendishii DSM 21758 TaxID=1121302 RepID=A0A1M6K0C1_9CLOT|nr:phage minor capsid protein [Clostridium cavendishii]SHJ52380.1 Phage minor capsid protein 2 [Clostridium cavendishii DSM 21758]
MDKKNNPSKLGEILKNITKQSIQYNAAKEREKSYDIRRIFEQMELDLISSMHRAFYFHQTEQLKEGFEWEQWQLSKLRSMEKYRQKNKEIIGSYSNTIEETIERELQGSFSKGENRVDDLVNSFEKAKEAKEEAKVGLPDDIAERQKKTINKGNVPEDKDFFGLNEKKLNALQDTVKRDLKEAQHAVLRKMDDVYRQTIFKTHVYMQSGTKSLYQAIDMATKDFLDKGINCIEYKNGARVNIASYAEMALRTASQRATFLGEGKKRDEFGIHLVVVSAHANTCAMCEKWQGKVLIDDIFSHGSKSDGEYPLLSEAIKQGFLHANCRHTLITYFEGITSLPTVPDGKEAIKTYEVEQKQRALERQIRKWKRFKIGTTDETNKEDALMKVRQYEKELQELIQRNPQLRRNYKREEADIRSIKEINHKADLKEYEKFKRVLDNEVPETIDKFQELKYNDVKKWKSLKQKIRIKDDSIIGNPNTPNKFVNSNVKWDKHLGVSQNISDKLNNIHTELSEFMSKNDREKVILLDINSSKLAYELEGSKNDEVILNKEVLKILKNSKENSITLTHNHPSSAPFSRADIDKIMHYNSVKALTLECANGDKYLFDRNNQNIGFFKYMAFDSEYDKIYNRVAQKYPQLNDEKEIFNIWNIFLNDVNEEISKKYNMVYRKVD